METVNERRNQIQEEVDELERQLEDAEDVEDEDLINRLESEIDAFNVEDRLLEFVEDLDIDSI